MADRTRILVIEDEDMVRDAVRDSLTGAGYEVSGAANGEEGLNVLKTRPIDLVITDILMPEKEGIETIIEIRKARSDIKILAISGGGRERNLHPLEMAGKIGADMTLAKPFEPERLLLAVRDLLSGTPHAKAASASAIPQYPASMDR